MYCSLQAIEMRSSSASKKKNFIQNSLCDICTQSKIHKNYRFSADVLRANKKTKKVYLNIFPSVLQNLLWKF
jgi:hypothetical protein